MKPNCTKCEHFYITYEQSTPKACKIYKIKSAQYPSQVVKNANNGVECLGFIEKKKKK